MSSVAASLASAFSGAYRGPAPDPADGAPLGAVLAELAARGREAWPDVPLTPTALAAYLGARAPADAAPLGWLARQHGADLFLACACSERLPEALGAFEREFMVKVGAYLRGLHPTPELVADTQQELRTKLFVGGPEGSPKILTYAGQGPLGGWVRVAAVRTALDLLDAAKAGAPGLDEAEELARAIVPAGDPELELVREVYRAAFVAALREAIASLSRRDRALLRFTFVEQLTPARLGTMYDVHRTTAMRWIDAAQAEVLAGTRARMMARLDLTPSECDGVLGLVKSRIDVAIGSLLRSAS